MVYPELMPFKKHEKTERIHHNFLAEQLDIRLRDAFYSDEVLA